MSAFASPDPAPSPVQAQKSNRPTNKWFATQVTALAALATMYFTTGGWDVEENISLVGIVAQAAISWLVPNDNTPGGVPPKNG